MDMTPEEQALTAEIGQRLREARHQRRLSLSALAALTGGALAKSRIASYEQGLRRLGIEQAQVLAKSLGNVSATYLLCLDDGGFLNSAEQGLVRQFRAADERGRRTILAVAESACGVGLS